MQFKSVQMLHVGYLEATSLQKGSIYYESSTVQIKIEIMMSNGLKQKHISIVTTS